MTETPAEVTRRLFYNGEALRVDVGEPPTGGGDKYEPQTAEQAQQILAPKIRSTVEQAMTLPSPLRGDYLYVEVRLLPNYLAASYAPDILLNHVGAVLVGSRADVGVYRTKTKETRTGTRRLILAFTDAGLERFQRLIEAPGRDRTERQAFEEIRKFDDIDLPQPESVLVSGPAEETAERLTWEAVLHPAASRGAELAPTDQGVLEKWVALVRRAEGTVHRDFIRTVGGLTFVPVSLSTAAAEDVVRFNPLRAMRPMPSIRPRPRFGARAASRLQPPSTLSPVAPDVVVAVFDGGVHDLTPPSPFFAQPAIDITSEPPDDDDLDHGTGVTAAVLYGLAQPGTQATQPPTAVQSYRVLPAPNVPGDLYGYWVLDQIRDTVVRTRPAIVNLSLGPELAVEDSTEPNRWTAELDQLAWDQDVLFVVASGNAGEADQRTGLHRVQVPADMVNGLAVGACDSAPPAKPWQRAPYSSMGPGRHGNRVQPAGVQFGGTLSDPFPLIRGDGLFLNSHGTSFATPLVTHALAELSSRLPVATPAVLRAFAIHFAERHGTHKKLIHEVGFGRFPLSFTPLLDCGPDEVHVLFVAKIRRGERLGYRLPVPDRSSDVNIQLTLAYTSPTEPSQPTEYTRASLELTLRPHHLLHRFSPPSGSKDKPVDLVITSAQAFEFLNAGWKSSQEPVARGLAPTAGATERQLRDAGKWETVRHHRVSVAAAEVEQPRLEVAYLARRAGALDNNALEIPFAILATLTDRSKSGDFHDRARAQFAALTPLPRTQARLHALRTRLTR